MERWPLISQLIDGTQVPEFDNLYLDMNSILHTCTHTNDDTLHRLTDDQMYAAIFSYIEHLFEIIKPNKVFYMAIDGVAPRAKMNQQRARRFRTAFEAEENLKKAIDQGLEIPKEDPFDSNAITPGTEFMAKLTDNLKYFIHKKISEDSKWSNVQIILSGHEVPGEGEHKIMEYIRTLKNQPDSDPNLRHCIYGLDADLIMLGLVSHYPHFALLREEVTFGPRSQKKSNDLNDQQFYLLHISLLREYLSLEFQDLDSELNFEYNFERVLDDFILIMYVIGNDFLPHLPDLHINKGAFPLLLETFKQALKQSDGYLNENGTINLKRLDIWLHSLAEFELENFEKQDIDVEWFNKKLEDISITGEKRRDRMGKLLILKDQKKLVGMIKPWLLSIAAKPIDELNRLTDTGELPSLTLPTDEIEKHIEFIKTFALEVGLIIVHSKSEGKYEARLDVDGISPHEVEEEHEARLGDLRKTIKKYQSANLIDTEELLKESKDIYDSKFVSWKDKYYQDKLHFSINDKENMIDLTQNYLEGLQWVLYYYYKGCPSWNWFFRYHYAPRISDISIGLHEYLNTNSKITFDKSEPFKPFEQLMAVLPARSRKLIPLAYRSLMTDPHSPIFDFYPHEVDIDMNGKNASWEAVVLLSFVDEKRLIDALRPIEAKLSPEEQRRNSYGNDIKFIFNPQIDCVYPTPLPGFFHDIEHDKCYEEPFILPEIEGEIKIELGDGALLGKKALAGFPTLHTIPFEHELKIYEVRVFQNPSKSESMILTLKNIWEDISVYQFSQKFINKIVYSRWPFLRESRVVSVSDKEFKYESIKTQNSRKVVSSPLSPEESKTFHQTVRSITETFDKTKGIRLGEVEGLVHVQPVNGLIRNEKGAYVKTFSKDIEVYPIQLIVEEVHNEDPRFAARPPQPIDQEFPLESQVIFLGSFAYGTPATVVGYTDDSKVNVKISKIPSSNEPNIGRRRLDIEKKEIAYFPSYDVAKKLKINPLFLSKITSGFMIDNDFEGKKRVNIGLQLKFEGRRQKVLGFTKKSSKVWEFSPLAIQLIKDYRDKFPKLFTGLQNCDQHAIPSAKTLFSKNDELKEVNRWLKEVRLQLMTVSLESESFTKFSFQAIESYMEDFITIPVPYSNKDIKGVPKNAILDPSESYQLLSTQKFELGDRVIYVQGSGKVPYLSKGTVVSVTTFGAKISLGVIFDYPLLSGNNMNGKLKTNRGLTIDSSLVLNLSNKQLLYHSNASRLKQKVLTPAEKKKKAALLEQTRREKEEKERAKKEESAKQTNELLNLLRKNDKDEGAKKDAQGSSGDAQGNGQDLLKMLKGSEGSKSLDKDEDVPQNADAIKRIYGQIYSNVMNEGTNYVQPPPPTQNYGIPVVPGIPLPPQFFQQQMVAPPGVSMQQAPQELAQSQTASNRRPARNDNKRSNGNKGSETGSHRGAKNGSTSGNYHSKTSERGRGGSRGSTRESTRGSIRGSSRGSSRGSTRGKGRGRSSTDEN